MPSPIEHEKHLEHAKRGHTVRHGVRGVQNLQLLKDTEFLKREERAIAAEAARQKAKDDGKTPREQENAYLKELHRKQGGRRKTRRSRKSRRRV